jgi:hypothetical protein
MKTDVRIHVKVADEVWIAMALLHREHPHAKDFSVEEIVERARREHLHEPLRPGVYVHAALHCVANRAPNPGRYRMLFETVAGRRRLFHEGDPYHPGREGSKTTPEAEAIPENYRELLDWYRDWSDVRAKDIIKNDPLRALRGLGKHIWAGVDPDEYVRSLREGWE